jgi:hypothetical protein
MMRSAQYYFSTDNPLDNLSIWDQTLGALIFPTFFSGITRSGGVAYQEASVLSKW